jgi:hypothetical protein
MATDASTCKSCAAGSFSLEGSASCIVCDTTQEWVLADDQTSCTCARGTKCDTSSALSSFAVLPVLVVALSFVVFQL